jgi:molybdopterin molybdotransferase
MDGYALRAFDVTRATPMKPVRVAVTCTVFAGDTARRALRKGECVRIMTGAPVPRGGDAVIPIERATVDGTELIVDAPVVRERHVRRRGEEISKGTSLVGKGAVVTPGTMACIATAGLATVRVIRKPLVSVIATGSETVAPGKPLRHGQIYDSNSGMIEAALNNMRIAPVAVRRVKDQPAALERAVNAALRRSDVVIIIGGVSVGDHDYVRDILNRQRVKEVFWRVAQKPGKPLYFGTRGRKLVFGLPGNPASAFTCFYVYVYPALRQLAGHPDGRLVTQSHNLNEPVQADARRWRFLKGTSGGDSTVTATPRQASHMITTLAQADRLIVIPPGDGRVTGPVQTLKLPYAEDAEV